jgi:hypothetical protein
VLGVIISINTIISLLFVPQHDFVPNDNTKSIFTEQETRFNYNFQSFNAVWEKKWLFIVRNMGINFMGKTQCFAIYSAVMGL